MGLKSTDAGNTQPNFTARLYNQTLQPDFTVRLYKQTLQPDFTAMTDQSGVQYLRFFKGPC